MRVYKVLTLLTFVFLHPIPGQVDISGVVNDKLSGAPVADAEVKLLKANLITSTDSAGKFILAGTAVRKNRLSQAQPSGLIDPKRMVFHHDAEGYLTVRILDLSGRVRGIVFDGVLPAGDWQVLPPELSPGVYLYLFDAPGYHHTIRFLASMKSASCQSGMVKRIGAGESSCITSGAAKHQAASEPVDTLLVSKDGYRQVSVSVNSYQADGLEILLEDTTSVVSDNATIVPDPSWTCFMPEGIPPPSLGTEVFTLTMKYSSMHDVGITRFGHRRQFDISGGTVKGEMIDGTVLEGGLDYELTLSNGSVELEQIVILRAGSTPILMRNAGVAPAGAAHVRVVLDFEAPNSSSYTWLHSGTFAADRVVDSTAKTIILSVYDITDVSFPDKKIEIKDPADAENQTWECFEMNGSQGTTVFTENVTLGSSISIGASKRGSRNIIPITGGTTSGKVTGKILSGGADYQLGGLDARYTLAPDDGEFIIVRNCGGMNGLVPVFEARVDGPYNYLNENKYLSSSPGMGSGGVTITFYEKK